jgi:hypothetical protein
MTPADIRLIGSLLDLLREKNVRHFKGHFSPLGDMPVEIELFEAEAAPPAQMKDIEGAETPPCKCGHANFEHQDDGSCLRGCEIEKCAGPEAK